MTSSRRSCRRGPRLLLALLAACALQARAEPVPDLDLPPPARVRELLLTRAEVQAAQAALAADAAEAQRQRRGPAEFSVRATGQDRGVREAGLPGQHWREGQLALERPLRSAAKARQDGTLADAIEALARVERADVLHEASRTLLRTWTEWLRERGTVVLWREQLQAQDTLLSTAERRVRVGDAARTELRLQEASRAQVQAQLAAAELREQVARATLELHYPGLAEGAGLPRAPQEDDLPPGGEARVLADLEERSHAWRAARARAALARERAARVALDQRPDPTVGVHLGSERGGAERLVGVSVSLPLAGAARSDATRSALARADEAERRAEAVALQVRTQARADWLSARSALALWRSAEEARRRYAETVAMLERGWQLGELSQGDVLAARRQLVDAALAELAARVDARHAALRLRVDLHTLWDLDEE